MVRPKALCRQKQEMETEADLQEALVGFFAVCKKSGAQKSVPQGWQQVQDLPWRRMPMLSIKRMPRPEQRPKRPLLSPKLEP
jgi:hypothetical protein